MATTRTSTEKTTGAAAIHVVTGEHPFNGEDEDFLVQMDWRRVFVEFREAQADRHLAPERSHIPNEISWVDLAIKDFRPPEWIPSLIALRGTITHFEVDPRTQEEEVILTIELLPAHSTLIDLLKRGMIADKLFSACLRSVSLFPRGGVQEGSSFTAYLSMGYQRIWSPDASAQFQPIKLVWDLKVEAPPTRSSGWSMAGVKDAWKRLRGEGGPVWSPSDPRSENFSAVEATLMMDLHLVLLQLWNVQFGRNEDVASQLREQAGEVVRLGSVRPVYGKAALRPWTGPDLFVKSK